MILSPDEAKNYLASIKHGGLTELSNATGINIVRLSTIRNGKVKNPSCDILQKITDYRYCQKVTTSDIS